jgi:hypothetical protein
VFDLLEVRSVVWVGVVGHLLTSGPEDDVISRAIEVAQQSNAEKHARERKRQTGNDDKRKIREVRLTFAGAHGGVAGHDGYFTFGWIGFEQWGGWMEPALELLQQKSAIKRRENQG